jgi:hypothetical protein
LGRPKIIERYQRPDFVKVPHLDDEAIEELAAIAEIHEDNDVSAMTDEVTQVFNEYPLDLKEFDQYPRPANIAAAFEAIAARTTDLLDYIDILDLKTKRLLMKRNIDIRETYRRIEELDIAAAGIFIEQGSKESRHGETKHAFWLCVNGLVEAFKRNHKVDINVEGERPLSLRKIGVSFVACALNSADIKCPSESTLARRIPASQFKRDD